MSSRRKHLHVFGRHLGVPNWHEIMVGEQGGPLGQLALGLTLLYEESESIVSVSFGTGASRIGEEFEAQMSARVMSELYQSGLKHGRSRSRNVERLIADAVVDTQSQNALEELCAVRDHMKTNLINSFVGVSSASHLPRCVALGDKVFAGANIRTVWIPSETRYAGSTPGDMVVVEHPHRADDPLLARGILPNQILAGVFRVKDKARLLLEIEALIERHQVS